MALIQEARKDAAKHLSSLENCIKADPTYALAWYLLGQAALRSGDSPKAVEAFKRSLQLDPGNQTAQKTLLQLNPS